MLASDKAGRARAFFERASSAAAAVGAGSLDALSSISPERWRIPDERSFLGTGPASSAEDKGRDA